MRRYSSGKPAAIPVVADLDQLILQRTVGEVVADPAGDIEALARFAALTDQRANLIRLGLEHERIDAQPEVRDGEEEVLVRLDFRERTDRRELPVRASLRVVLQNLFEIERARRGST